MNELQTTNTPSDLFAGIGWTREERLARLVDVFLAGRPETTRKRYRGSLELFAALRGIADYRAAAAAFVLAGRAAATELALATKDTMLTSGRYRPSSVNNMLAVLRGLTDTANEIELIDWNLPRLRLKNVKVRTYRDTRGPGADAVRAMLAQTEGHAPKQRRDRALLALMGAEAFRRSEVVSLDLSHVDLSSQRLEVLRKGQREREWITVSGRTWEVLRLWIEARGDHDGPLFTSFDRAGKGSGRLTPEGVYHMTRKRGKEAGVGPVWPHGLRHTAVTAALDLTNGNTAGTRAFSGHSSVNTVEIYDDNRRDRRKAITELVSAAVF